MRTSFSRATIKAGLLLLSIVVLCSAGCVAGGGYGYYDEGYPAYGGYYGDYVVVDGEGRHHRDHDYRGWGPGYHVGPGRHEGREDFERGGGRGGERGGEHGGFERGGRGGGGHSFRSAPASHPTPSIPGHGAFHGGGAHGGGAGGRH